LFVERRGFGSQEADLLFTQESKVDGTSDPVLCLGQRTAAIKEVMKAFPEMATTYGFGDVRSDGIDGPEQLITQQILVTS
jgi:hypothetical protein